MKDTQELRLYIDPNVVSGARIGAVCMLFPVVVFISLYGTVRGFLAGTYYYPLSFLLLGPVILFSIMFFLAVTVPFWFPKKGAPVAILNKDGVWHYRFGLIPWSDINYFGPYSQQLSRAEIIGIRVNDSAKLAKQSSIAGKLEIFCSKWRGDPPITVLCLPLTKEEVIHFAKQFLNDETC